MTVRGPQLVASPVDSRRFGIEVGRVVGDTDDRHADAVGELVATQDDVDLVILRVPAGAVRSAARATSAGARLCDLHLEFERLTVLDASPAAGISVAGPDRAGEVAALFRRAFTGYTGHYHADHRLSAGAATEAYADWAHRCTGGGEPDTHVLVRDVTGSGLVGATILRLAADDPLEAHGLLDAVDPRHRRRGHYAALGRERLRLAAELGAKRLLVATHLQNLAACRGLEQLGFRIRAAELTYHAWRDERRKAP